MIQDRKAKCKTLSLLLAITFVLLSFLSFFFYLDLKRSFIGRISEKATSILAQPVEIGDVRFSIASGIKIEALRVLNPEGFPSGQLLGIEEIVILPDYRELIKGRLHFRSINLHSPALTIFENGKGRLNISDELRNFLSKKGTTEYRIDELRLVSALAAFNDDTGYRVDRANLLFQNLSSAPGMKTSLTGDFYWAGDNNIRLDGWANLQDEPKQFTLSASGEEIRLSSFRETLKKYGIDPENTRMKMLLDLSGDTDQGVSIRSGIEVRSPGHELYRKGPIGLTVDADAFYEISDRLLTIKDLTVKSTDESSVRVSGRIRNIPESPDYDLGVMIGRIDLSGFNVFHGFSASGILSSDLIKVKGRLDKFPVLEGSVELKKGSVKSAWLELRNTDGRITFIPGQAPAARAEFSSDILKAGGYPFPGPATIKLSIQAKQSRQELVISSTLTSSPVMIKISDQANLTLKDLHVELDGVRRGKLFSGRTAVKMRGIHYADLNFEKIRSGFEFSYQDGDIAVKNPRIATDSFSAAADAIKLDTRAKGQLSIEAKNVSGAYPSMKTALERGDFNAILHSTGKEISGSINFIAAGVAFEDFKSRKISGKAIFNKRDFTLDVPDADLGGGKVMLAARGRTSEGPFPVKVKMTAEDLDLGAILSSEKLLSGYRLSGDLQNGSFEGVLVSKESVDGEIKLELRKLSLLNNKTKRHLIKDLSISPLIRLRGKDSDFRTAVKAGNINLAISGTARNFLSEERELELIGKLNETPVNEIRTAFWDSFPDKLLYAGLEGSAASEITVRYKKSRTAFEGNMSLKNVTIEGENGEYLAGPVNGTIPFAYGKFSEKKTAIPLPSFERADFEKTSRHYADAQPGGEYNRVTMGDIRYGFRLLSGVTVWIKQDEGVLNIGRFSANIFGGKLNGSGVIDFSDGLQYRGGMILEGVSLTTLGNDIEPVKGYISGKLNGIGLIRGSEGGLAELIGRADFWTYATRDEKMRISREFLQKIGGPSIKPYVADRNFDKGVVSLYIQKGFFIFRELEISNRNIIGIQDLSVKVAPLSNRIAIDHLMWTIVEAAERAKQREGSEGLN